MRTLLFASLFNQLRRPQAWAKLCCLVSLAGPGFAAPNPQILIPRLAYPPALEDFLSMAPATANVPDGQSYRFYTEESAQWRPRVAANGGLSGLRREESVRSVCMFR